MTNIPTALKQLKLHIKVALARYTDLKEDVKKEQEKHQQLLVEKQNLENEILQLKEQVKTIKLAQAIHNRDDQSTRELKNQINRYIKEIDKCLQLIKRE